MLENVEVTIKVKKYRFSTETCDSFEYVVRPGRSKIASHNMDGIRGVQTSTNLKELCFFLELCICFYDSSRHLQFTASVNKNLRQDKPTTFGYLNDEKTQSLDSMKEALTSPTVLVIPNWTDHIHIWTKMFVPSMLDLCCYTSKCKAYLNQLVTGQPL